MKFRTIVSILVVALVATAATGVGKAENGKGKSAAPSGAGGNGKGAPHGDGATPGKPSCNPSQVFENDEVALWFQGHKEHVQVTNKNSTTGEGTYSYKSREIREVDAANATVRYMNVGRAFPQSSTCEIHDSAESAHMWLNVTDAVRNKHGGEAGSATVSFAWHFNKSDNGAKFDLLVFDWPWADATEGSGHRLAYEFTMTAGGALVLEPASNGVGVRNTTGTPVGFVMWAPNATVTYADFTEKTANVTSNTTGGPNEVRVVLTFVDVEPGYVKLDYDPWVGVGKYVIVLDRLIALEPLLPSEARGLAHRL
ncbi:MAG TPA: hypothetical protein VI997_02065 [Candidatus Thermoplasmatota archaeon]|nr:hypothetical protein [Candidatus Thermoplasmatota archaeon]